MITLGVKYLKSFINKSVGLLGEKKPYPVYFKTRFGIHTFGMKFAIDVLILDSNNEIVKTSQSLMPNRIFLWNPRFDKVIELPEGEIKKNKIRFGDKINLEIITNY